MLCSGRRYEKASCPPDRPSEQRDEAVRDDDYNDSVNTSTTYARSSPELLSSTQTSYGDGPMKHFHCSGHGHHVDGGHRPSGRYTEDGDDDDDEDDDDEDEDEDDSQNITQLQAKNEAMRVSIAQLEEELVELHQMLEQHKTGCQSKPQRCRHAPDTGKQPGFQATES
ncbi:bromodomain-containing factor 1 [Microdochium nivale]|nr:bromodomain-containing factor 1 [Microdochium nivale]